MHFYIMTLFPEMVLSGLSTSILGRGMEQGRIQVDAYNIRDYAHNKHNKVDDYQSYSSFLPNSLVMLMSMGRFEYKKNMFALLGRK